MYGLSPVATSSKVLKYQGKLEFFQPSTDMLLHQIFDTMLSFAARVLSGEIKDSEDTTKWTFEQVYSFVRPNAREDWVETVDSEKELE